MKSKKINRRSKTVIILNLILILVLMTVSVYAWFAVQVENRVDAYDVVVMSDKALELSFDKTVWGGSLNLSSLKDKDGESVMKNLRLVDVTSDGTTFRIPTLTQQSGYAEVNPGGTWTNAQKNKDYLDFTVYMRSKSQLSVYLSNESKATPVSAVLTGENCGNPSPYVTGANAFSKDCIVGALRVAFTNSAGENNIWITNPQYLLGNTKGGTEYTMTTDATNKEYGTTDFEWSNPYKHYYYDAKNTLKESENVLTTIPSTSTDNKTLVATLSGPDADGYYTGEVNIKMWLDGCDTESRRALVGGKFNLSLIFDSISTISAE